MIPEGGLTQINGVTYIPSPTTGCPVPAPPAAPFNMPAIPGFGGAPAPASQNYSSASNEWTGYRADPPVTNSPSSPTSNAAAPEGDPKIRALAEKCGQTVMATVSSRTASGTAACGTRVGEMAKCMGNGMGHPCGGHCGNGKDFVDCADGALTQCGFTKVPANSPDCNMPGAIRSYTKTPTPAGTLYGHVEFVCGQGKYCSVYRSGALDRPWPRDNADGCWYPTSALGSSPGADANSAGTAGSPGRSH